MDERAKNLKETEEIRTLLQGEVDAGKTRLQRNSLGQFSTPDDLAGELLVYAKEVSNFQRVKFFDPAFGMGGFYAAFLKAFGCNQSALGFEVDADYHSASQKVWNSYSNLSVKKTDFTREDPRNYGGINLIVCNPPYVRHQHFSAQEKSRLRVLAESTSGQKISGLAGMHAYFMLLAHTWLDEGGLGIWLVPSEIMEVNYGASIKRYLLSKVELVRIHFFDQKDEKFDDALVSSCVVVYRKRNPATPLNVEVTFGNSFLHPSVAQKISSTELAQKDKWSKHLLVSAAKVPTGNKIGDLFSVKRGIATGSNSFFVLEKQDAMALHIPKRYLKNVLPPSRFLKDDVVKLDKDGFLDTEKKLALLDIDLPIEEIQKMYPLLYDYLQRGIAFGVHKTYIASHRFPWYSQEKRESPEYFVRYMNRESKGLTSHHSIFIKNEGGAIATNAYLMLYKKALGLFDVSLSEKKVWECLQKGLSKAAYSFGRTYGGGLVKFEPNELKKVPLFT